VLERKYGITVQVTRVTFWWYIASRGGYVNGTGTIDGDNARAETLTGATSVYAVLTFSNTQGFTTLPGTCAAV
jgi:hypothetical protein